jgi:hypothetical protein
MKLETRATQTNDENHPERRIASSRDRSPQYKLAIDHAAMPPEEIYRRAKHNANVDLENGVMPKPSPTAKEVATQTGESDTSSIIMLNKDNYKLTASYALERDTRSYGQILRDALQDRGDTGRGLRDTLDAGINEVTVAIGAARTSRDTTQAFDLRNDLEAFRAYASLSGLIARNNIVRINDDNDLDRVAKEIRQLLDHPNQFKRNKIKKLKEVFPPEEEVIPPEEN